MSPHTHPARALARRLVASLAPALALAALLVPAAAQTVPAPAFVHTLPEPDTGPFVSLGDHGGQAFVFTGSDCCTVPAGVELLSSTSGEVVWDRSTGPVEPLAVDSAETHPVHVAIASQAIGATGTFLVHVACWSSDASLPDWVYTHPRASDGRPDVAISRDGDVVTAFVERAGGAGVLDVVVLDGATGAVRSSTPVPGFFLGLPQPLNDAALSADGSTAVWNFGAEFVVFDVPSAQVVHVETLPFPHAGTVDVSADGARVTYCVEDMGSVTVLERAGPTPPAPYVPLLFHAGPAGGLGRVALSGDGGTVAAAYGGFPFPGTFVAVLAVDVDTGVETMSHTLLYSGIGQSVRGVEIADDGARFAVGVTGGDMFEFEPRILVYASDADAPVYEASTIWAHLTDLDLTADGDTLLVAGRTVDGTGAHVYLITPEPTDFAFTGTPGVGDTVTFTLSGTPGDAGLLVFGLGPADPPLVLSQGLLYLDPTILRLFGMGPIGPLGTASLSLTIPPDPILVGLELWSQGARQPSLSLTEDWRKVTLLP